eukprot:CAMPEP_0194391442 /NCGR_PEP_ID=MMETSP0174-20130528/115604_1 /TAXON_ID=216777 /ORGANISM="Proboscia alata, Strain PI-D3" /LENGTH=139 /DNA_ID=CAMNT_0039185757 /DNA_START=44 /DNA_END=459 /DNA_ORIENTATION=-
MSRIGGGGVGVASPRAPKRTARQAAARVWEKSSSAKRRARGTDPRERGADAPRRVAAAHASSDDRKETERDASTKREDVVLLARQRREDARGSVQEDPQEVGDEEEERRHGKPTAKLAPSEKGRILPPERHVTREPGWR